MVSPFPSVTEDRLTYHESTTSEQLPGRPRTTLEKVGIARVEESSVFRSGEDSASLQVVLRGAQMMAVHPGTKHQT